MFDTVWLKFLKPIQESLHVVPSSHHLNTAFVSDPGVKIFPVGWWVWLKGR